MNREGTSPGTTPHSTTLVNIAVNLGFALALIVLVTLFVGTAHAALYWSLIVTVCVIAAVGIRLSLPNRRRR
ncbi:hypothetical protein [Rhodococcus sp. BS-15]|uniref:hypothetical protein n=1 Tax=Rhodococcus sp. BS-15 TaxID=1304954 RepID=UPI000A5EBE85|nr:hypothetical protein [Rhodococcus sp. BS-15]